MKLTSLALAAAVLGVFGPAAPAQSAGISSNFLARVQRNGGRALVAEQASVSHPVQKIIALLNDLAAKAKKQGESEAVQFQQYSQWCKDVKKFKGRDIKHLTDMVAQHTANVKAAASDVEALSNELVKLQDELARHTSSLQEARDDNQENVKVFNAAMKDYQDTLDAIDGAIAAVTKSNSNAAPALAQIAASLKGKAATGSAAALLRRAANEPAPAEAAPSAAPAEAAPSAAPAAAAPAVDDSFKTPDFVKNVDRYPKRPVYEFKSGGVLEVLAQLKAAFTEEKRFAENSETTRSHYFQTLEQHLNQLIEDANAAVESKTQTKANRVSQQTASQAALDTASHELQLDTTYLQSVTTGCTTKAAEWEQRSLVRSDEAKVFAEAIKVLNKVAFGRTPEGNGERLNGAYGGKAFFESFLQVLTKHKAEGPSARMTAALQQALKVVSSLKHKEASDMAGLASALEEAVQESADAPTGTCRYCNKSPFEQLNQLIQKLVFKLTQDQTDEDTHKAWCDEENRKTKASHDHKTSKMNGLNAKADSLTAEINTLTADVSTIAKELEDLAKDLAAQTELRQKNKQENEASIQDSEAAQAALQEAVKMLTDFYKKTGALALPQTRMSLAKLHRREEPAAPAEYDPAAKMPAAPATWTDAYKQATGEQQTGSDVVELLQHIAADYAKMEADTKAAEQTDSTNFKGFQQQAAMSKAGKEQDSKLKVQRKGQATDELGLTHKEQKELDKELIAVNRYIDDLKRPCGETATTYAERKASRVAEIEALNTARDILKKAFEEVAAASAEDPAAFATTTAAPETTTAAATPAPHEDHPAVLAHAKEAHSKIKKVAFDSEKVKLAVASAAASAF